MNKIIISFLALCFSLQALANEPIVKTGSLSLDHEYKIEVTYLPEQDVKLTSLKTSYSPSVQDCNHLIPAQCWTQLYFKLGTMQIRILSGDNELINETAQITGDASFSRAPLDDNICEQNLPTKGTYSIYPLEFGKRINLKKNISLSINVGDVASVNIIENEIQLPVQLNLTKLEGWQDVNGQHMRLSSELHTEEEWIKIHEAKKKQPQINYNDRD